MSERSPPRYLLGVYYTESGAGGWICPVEVPKIKVAWEFKIMDGAQYFAAVRRLGLHPTGVPNVYMTATGQVQQVPNPSEYTPEQRVEIIEKLKEQMGIWPSNDR